MADILWLSVSFVRDPKNKAEMTWVTAETIYVPVHVEGNHWVLLVVSTLERSVTVYGTVDSNYTMQKGLQWVSFNVVYAIFVPY